MWHKTYSRIVAALLAVFLMTLSGCALRIPLGAGPGQALELQWFSPVQMPAAVPNGSAEYPTSRPAEP